MKRYIPAFVVVAFIAICAIAQVIDYPGATGSSGGSGSGAGNGLTNNDTRAIQFLDSLYVASNVTNGGSFRAEGVSTFTDDITHSGGTATLTELTAIGLAQFSAQIGYVAENYNGSNGVTATALTNNWDMTAKIFRPVTNVVGTNLTFTLSNVLSSASGITVLKGNGSYSNTVTFLAVSGVHIRWMNWATNGNYDVLVRPSANYTVQFFANSATNINAWVSSDDADIPITARFINVRAGQSASNAMVGGRLFTYVVAAGGGYTNCCASGDITNASQANISGHTLTNAGDQLLMRASGTYSTTGQSKGVQAVFGSQTMLDTGLQAVSNGTWRVEARIYAISGTAQYYEAHAHWDRAVGGGQTNVSGRLSQTNGIDTILKMRLQANVVSSVTNEMMTVDYIPARQ